MSGGTEMEVDISTKLVDCRLIAIYHNNDIATFLGILPMIDT